MDEEIAKLRARIAEVERRNSNLQEANTRYLEEGRAARRERNAALAELAQLKASGVMGVSKATFQSRVLKWLHACFGLVIASDKVERNYRFLEEALELVQICGCTRTDAYRLVDYVYGRPLGEIGHEVGGVMNTLAALCCAHGIDLNAAAEAEMDRVWANIEKIRAKQAAKPKLSPLPESTADHRSGLAPSLSEADYAELIRKVGLLFFDAGTVKCVPGDYARRIIQDVTLTGAPPPRRVRHLKRGSTYQIVGEGDLQSSSPIVEGARLMIYRCETDGRLWVRPVSEFEDGRFVDISDGEEK